MKIALTRTSTDIDDLKLASICNEELELGFSDSPYAVFERVFSEEPYAALGPVERIPQ